MKCNACPRQCLVDRETQKGFCGVNGITLARVGLHLWEEPCISGRRGSGTIFFSGCNLRCKFCQNALISRSDYGRTVSTDTLGQLMLYLQDAGAENINLVSPTHFIDPITETLLRYKSQIKIPVLYNSNGYESVERLKKLEGLIDIYLPDLKYADDLLAQSYSSVSHYFETATACISEMKRQVKKNLFSKGMLKKGMIVRHLVLPGQLENSKRVLDYLVKLDPKIYVSLMAQYFPTPDVQNDPELGRCLTPEEYDEVSDYLIGIGLINGYLQELCSNEDAYVPDFSLEALDEILSTKIHSFQ